MPGDNLESVIAYRRLLLIQRRNLFKEGKETGVVVTDSDELEQRRKLEKQWNDGAFDDIAKKLKIDPDIVRNPSNITTSAKITPFVQIKSPELKDSDYYSLFTKLNVPASLGVGAEVGQEGEFKIQKGDDLYTIKPGLKAFATAEVNGLLGDIGNPKGGAKPINAKISKGGIGGIVGVKLEVGIDLSFRVEISRFVNMKMRLQGLFSLTLRLVIINVGSKFTPLMELGIQKVDGEEMLTISKEISVKASLGLPSALSPAIIIEGACNKAILFDKNDDSFLSHIVDLIFNSQGGLINKAISDLLPSKDYISLKVANARGDKMARHFQDLTDSLKASRDKLWLDLLDEGKSSYRRALEDLITTLNKQHELLDNDFINDKYFNNKEIPKGFETDYKESINLIKLGRGNLEIFCRSTINSLKALTERHQLHLEGIRRDTGNIYDISLIEIPFSVCNELFTWMENNTISLEETRGFIDKKKLIEQLEKAQARQVDFKGKLEVILSAKLQYGSLAQPAFSVRQEVFYTKEMLESKFKNGINYDRYNRACGIIQNMRNLRNDMAYQIGRIQNAKAANEEAMPSEMRIFKIFQGYIDSYNNIGQESLKGDLLPENYENYMNSFKSEKTEFKKLIDRDNFLFDQIITDQSTIPQTKNYFTQLKEMLNAGLLDQANPERPTLK